jgi:hypothetical protein
VFNIVLRGKRNEVSKKFENLLCDWMFNCIDAIRRLQNALRNLKTAIHDVEVVVEASPEQAAIRRARSTRKLARARMGNSTSFCFR